MCLKILDHFSLQEGNLNLCPLSGVDIGTCSGRCDVLSLPRLGYKRLQLKSCLCSLSFFLGGSSCVSITRQPCRERLCGEELWPEVGLEVKPAPGWPLETAAPMKFDFNPRGDPEPEPPSSATRFLTHRTCEVMSVVSSHYIWSNVLHSNRELGVPHNTAPSGKAWNSLVFYQLPAEAQLWCHMQMTAGQVGCVLSLSSCLRPAAVRPMARVYSSGNEGQWRE